ncbi:hypothetical protein IFM89_000635 [Coptis chinensis]|uniref:Uncharacterized protein n=1 Tax=Coptis chinensis TaxID=261450 RepID=A0A835HC58_9MAGN|nr:hypothetical protein IFM89_000635 [Coptis chinensis]
MIDEVYKALLEKTKSVPGAKVENNRFCVSVHFRCVDEKVLHDRGQGFGVLVSKSPKDTNGYGFFAPISRMEVTVTSRAFKGLARKEILPIHE